MVPTQTHQEILYEAIEAFQRTTGFHARVKEVAHPLGNVAVDAEIEIVTPEGTLGFPATTKLVRGTDTLGPVAEQLAREMPEGILITRHVTPGMAKILQAVGLAFMDTGGNTFIRRPGLMVRVTGNPPAQQQLRQKAPLVFQPKGIQIVFALLCRGDLVNAPYREIARLAGVGLGTVDRAMKGLQEMGFVMTPANGPRRLVERERLLPRWAAAYVDILRHRLVLGRFTAPTNDWWGAADLGSEQMLWGGEVAAARLTGYLRPGTATLYARELPRRFLVEHALRKDLEGNVEILRMFWDPELLRPRNDLVPPLLVYTDLIGGKDERTIETARMIYDAEIAGTPDETG